MTKMQELFERQAAWQKRRAALSWAEKVRMAATVREDIIRLRRSAPWPAAESVATSATPPRKADRHASRRRSGMDQGKEESS